MPRHIIRAANRRGDALVITLVSLVVLFVVIAAVVLGVIIPAVGSAREAARRMQCTNNLKMILLGFHNFHDVNRALPPASAARLDNSFDSKPIPGGAGHFVWILPYLGSDPLNSEIREAGFPNPHTNESGIYSTDIWVYQCPTDTSPRLSSWVNNAGKVNYCGSWGDSIYQTDESASTSRGVFQAGVFKDEDDPEANPRVVVKKLSDLTDGTSNTIAYSEMVAGDVEGSKRVKGGIALISDAAKIVAPQNVLNVAKDDVIEGAVCNFTRGQCWADGSVSVTGFQTILPPNSPSARMFAEKEKVGAGHGICSASSYHSGGVNVAFADGSVRFVPDTIDCGDLTADVDGSKYETTKESHGNEFKGPSPFGVWGALGTINGGEVRTAL